LRQRLASRLFLACAGLSLALGPICASGAAAEWPRSAGVRPSETARAEPAASLVRSQPVCVGSSDWAAGTLGETLLFRVERRGNQLFVGYFAYWSCERPWGKNVLSFTLLPALLIDAFYSHTFFVLPGAQQAIYGAGDVEGALVAYVIDADQTLHPRFAIAENGLHEAVRLEADELVDDRGRVILLSEVWSHQLGGHRAAARARSAASLRCFVGEALEPLTPELAANFRLGSPSSPERAKAAWRIPPETM